MKRFIIALQFLTRISLKPDLVVDQETFGRSMVFFPVVGLLIGGTLAFTAWMGQQFLTPVFSAVLILAVEVALTGGLHLDGFMDTMDGLFSGRSRERILEIMKDSRVGAHSVIALTLLLLLKGALLLEIPPGLLVLALILMPMYGRLGQVFLAVFFPYVRTEGLGKLFKDYVGPGEFWPGLLLALAAGWLAFKGLGIILALAMVGIIAGLGKAVAAKLGGLTGDTYGAVSEMSELIFLLLIYLLSRTGWLA